MFVAGVGWRGIYKVGWVRGLLTGIKGRTINLFNFQGLLQKDLFLRKKPIVLISFSLQETPPMSITAVRYII